MVYLSGTEASPVLRFYTATNYPIATAVGGRAVINEVIGGNWVLSEVTNSDFCLTHYYATNGVNSQIIGIIGQKEYPTQGTARAGAYVEIHDLSLGTLTVLTPEFVPIATVI